MEKQYYLILKTLECVNLQISYDQFIYLLKSAAKTGVVSCETTHITEPDKVTVISDYRVKDPYGKISSFAFSTYEVTLHD